MKLIIMMMTTPSTTAIIKYDNTSRKRPFLQELTALDNY